MLLFCAQLVLLPVLCLCFLFVSYAQLRLIPSVLVFKAASSGSRCRNVGFQPFPLLYWLVSARFVVVAACEFGLLPGEARLFLCFQYLILVNLAPLVSFLVSDLLQILLVIFYFVLLVLVGCGSFWIFN